MITLSEVSALGSIYYQVRAYVRASAEQWHTMIDAFFYAYTVAAASGHSSTASVVGFISEKEHAAIAAKFETLRGEMQPGKRLAQLDILAGMMAEACFDEFGETPTFGAPSEGLTQHSIKAWKRVEVEPGLWQEGDVCFHYDGDGAWSNLELLAHHPNSKAALMHWAGRGPSHAYFTNCRISGQNWGVRSYRVRDERYDSCTFEDIPREHGYYVNLMGGGEGLLMENCFFRNIAAQCVQTVSAAGRPKETPDPVGDNVPGGSLRLFNILAVNVGNDSENAVGGGTSYPFSWFRAKHKVEMIDVFLDNSMQIDSHGVTHCEGWGLDDYSRQMLWTGGWVKLNNPNRPVGKFHTMPRVDISSVDFQVKGGQNKLEFLNCGEIRVEDCAGDTRIVVDGEDVGPVSAGFVRT